MQTKNYWEISLKTSDGEGMMRERERERWLWNKNGQKDEMGKNG